MDIFLKINLTVTILTLCIFPFTSYQGWSDNVYDKSFRHSGRLVICAWLIYAIAWVWL